MADLTQELGDYQTTEDYMNSFDPVPPDKYEAMITDSSVENTKSNNGGKVLKLTWTIMSGDYQGRLVFDNVNIKNPSEKATEIGRKQLNSISAACGYPAGSRITESAMLHDRLCVIDVRIEGEKTVNGQTYAPKNTIKGYAPSTATASAAQVAAPEAPPAAAPQPPRPAPTQQQPAMAGAGTGGGKPPWLRK
jgi:hypothetical protein